MNELNKFFEQALKNKFANVAFWTVLSVATFFGLSYGLQFLMVYSVQYFEKPTEVISNPIFTTIYSMLFFATFSAIMYFVPKKIFGQKLSDPEVGIAKEMTWADFVFGLVGLVVSMILAGVAIQAAQSAFPDFDSNQTQNLGFSGMVRQYEFVLAFICLTIVPALSEEFVFRGIIFGQLRKINPLFAIIWTSLLFGAAHLQLNVAIVTFVMSVVMCVIREKFTDSIWAGVILHFVKNAIAFAVLYLLPNFLL